MVVGGGVGGVCGMGHAVMMRLCCCPGFGLGEAWFVEICWPMGSGRMSGFSYALRVSALIRVFVQGMLLPGWLALHCNEQAVSKHLQVPT